MPFTLRSALKKFDSCNRGRIAIGAFIAGCDGSNEKLRYVCRPSAFADMATEEFPEFMPAEGAGGAILSAGGAGVVEAGTLLAGADVQHVGAGEQQQDDRLRQQRACAASEQRARPAEQRSVAAANLNMVTLLVEDGNPQEAKRLAPKGPPKSERVRRSPEPPASQLFDTTRLTKRARDVHVPYGN
jgi:hypothetical protein